jgi:flagellar motor switch protein FliM
MADEDQEDINDEDVAAEWAAMAGDDDEDAGDGDAAAGGGDGGGDGDGEDVDQDAMADEWGALADDDGDDGEEVQSTRVLNQDEIDSLLGFSDDMDDDGSQSGIKAIINSTLVSYERLPMLEIVYDRLVRMLSTTLRNFTGDNVEVSLDNITSIRFGDYLNSIPLPAMLAVFKAEEWDNYGLLTIDSALIYSIVDVLLGGRKQTASLRIEGRPYTTIERNLVEGMVHVILNDLSAAFDPLSPATFRFDRLETNPRFATIGRSANAVILAKLRVDMEDRGGKIELCLPYATLEPIRELLLQMFMGEKFGRDSIWETHLANELWRTDVEINALLGEVSLSLDDIINLEPGAQVLLNAGPQSDVVLRCGNAPLFVGKMGQNDGNIAIRVEDKAPKVQI